MISLIMWNLKRNDTNELTYKTDSDLKSHTFLIT